ncbi:MAG TPA: hypothetical protein PLR12_02350, partial [Clostridia bacterium]|nr:hypothetical protein [Clostridia bacterium]
MKKLIIWAIAAAMLLSSVAVLADAPREAVAEAARFVPQGATLSSTGEDANTLELTFKDNADNEYLVLLSKNPLQVMRVNMKSTDESGGKRVQLEESAVRAAVQQAFPGAVTSQVFVEAKGEDELFFLAIFEHAGQFYKARFNTMNGRMTHYVMRGLPLPGQLPGVNITAEQAKQLAIAQAGGGVVTDIQFGFVGGEARFLVEVRFEGRSYKVQLRAKDGSLVGLHSNMSSLMDLAGFPVFQDPGSVITGNWDDDRGSG